jgi:antitoxin MazE
MAVVADVAGVVKPWGNGLGVRLTKPVAEAAGVTANAEVSITAQPGRIIVQIKQKRRSLGELLAAFDPVRHGGEALAFKPAGKEVL